MGLGERLLQLTGDAEAAPGTNRLSSIRSLLLLYAAAQSWNALLLQTGLPTSKTALAVMLFAALGLSGCFAASLARRFGVLASRVAVGLLVVQFVPSLPGITNHLLLALWCLLFPALLGEDEEPDSALILQALRWSAVLLLFGCGVQKLLAGTWFQGDFAAYSIAVRAPLGQLFAWTLPASEVARLQALDLSLAGVGPFRATSPMLLTVSNLVWVLELALPLGLLLRRTRRWVALAAIVFIVVFYLFGGRDPLWTFAMISLLLLFTPKLWLEIAFWPLVASYLYVLGMSIGVLPGAGMLRLSDVPGRVHL